MSLPANESSPLIAYVAINTPAADGFDYLAEGFSETQLQPGTRVIVPFRQQQCTAVLIETRRHTEIPAAKLKRILNVIDDSPLLSTELMQLGIWISRYYHHPLGEVIYTILPTALRKQSANKPDLQTIWQIADPNTDIDLRNAPKQQQVYQALIAHPAGLDKEFFEQHFMNWRPAIKSLLNKGIVIQQQLEHDPGQTQTNTCANAPNLNTDQQSALEQIRSTGRQFQPWLLQGVTGSGKTEIYLRLIEQNLQMQRQSLILVPEIGLTPQLLQRFRSRLPVPIYLLHSDMSDRQRLQTWHAAKRGQAQVIIGTRSAVFVPLTAPGLIIVDEEHDNSLKQQEGLRYHARDIAVVRAQRLQIPIVLGSATPSLETLHNAIRTRYGFVQLPARAGAATLPQISLVDARLSAKSELLSRPLHDAMQAHLQRGSQVLIFLNRRGYAPMLHCHTCGWSAECSRCDAHMTLHKHDQRLRCHHCGHEEKPPTQCPGCANATLDTRGLGTEQLERYITQHFADFSVTRIDRDTTRRKGVLEQKLAQAESGAIDILIGTQMLAKGHHFPKVALVGILGIDQGLFSADFRGPEYMAQLITQVAGRAGRIEQRGEVLIETYQPEHPLLRLVIQHNYQRFAEAALSEREQAALPPFTHLALVRAEAVAAEQALEFLGELRRQLASVTNCAVQILGPIPAPMERRAGRYRAQLLLQSVQRPALQQTLEQLRKVVDTLPMRRKVRWSIDVDPIEML